MFEQVCDVETHKTVYVDAYKPTEGSVYGFSFFISVECYGLTIYIEVLNETFNFIVN